MNHDIRTQFQRLLQGGLLIDADKGLELQLREVVLQEVERS